MKKPKVTAKSEDSKEGFTLIEVMLVLAITGLMLVGLIGGSYTTIARQRYTDALNSFAEYLSRTYSEVISPESLGQGTSDRNSGNLAILGKVLVFGYNYSDSERDTRSVYSATLVGSADISRASDQEFIDEITSADTDAKLFCGDASRDLPTTVSLYTPLWETTLTQTIPDQNQPFQGTVVIARTPTSSTVHTIYAPDLVYNLRDNCTADNDHANTQFTEDFQEHGRDYYHADADNQVKICLKAIDNAVIRQINLAVDGSNTSAVSILDESESQCR